MHAILEATPIHLDLTPLSRQQLIGQIANDFTMDTAKRIVRGFADATGMSCEQAADIMIDAWRSSKEDTVEDLEKDALCFERIVMYP